MKRIIVIGCPGSGKSRFSKALHKKTKLPLYHLDMMYWNADRTTVSRDIFHARLTEVLTGEEWIIDGNYSSTLELRVGACDAIFFLDYAADVCLAGVKERRGKKRTDMPWVEQEEDAELTEYIKSFADEQRPAIIDLLARHSEKHVTVFKCRAEADEFLDNFYETV